PQALPELFDVRGEQLAQGSETRLLFEVVADVPEGPRNVLDVDGIAAGGRLVAERAEGFEVALQRHHVKTAPELRLRHRDSLQGEEVGDQLVDRLLRQIDIRIAQEGHQVVR